MNELLKQVSLICEKYDKIAEITGEDFNIFQTLNLQYTEWSHSKIIAEFLNPKGLRGVKDEFLKLFLDKIVEVSSNIEKLEDEEAQKNRDDRIQKLKDYIQNQEFKSERVETEKTTNSGRVDIVIGKQIVIENKIYAEDQNEQLARYRKDYPEAIIIYLTLDGREPQAYSTSGDKNSYDILLSYKDDIIDWLEQCLEKSVNFSYLRETIAQYLNLLKFLTGQSRRKEISDEIIQAIMESPKNVESAFAIADKADKIKEQIIFEKFIPAMRELAKTHGLELSFNEYFHKWWKISLVNKELQDNCIRICFEFEDSRLRKFIYGFAIGAEVHDIQEKAQETYDEKNLLRDYIKAMGKNKQRPYWFHRKELYPVLDGKLLAGLFSEESEVIKNCGKKIEELLDMIKDFEG
ncbi:MAG: PD-(D/E)XK nuclease family protein [Fibromonadaceae bacterium]|jgi:hypothetical protein|nr:PD-(D/E)XK nuclease family protein [Fibromonadaceae bacterium]